MIKSKFPRCLYNRRKHLGILLLFINIISYSQSLKKNDPTDSISNYNVGNISIIDKESHASKKRETEKGYIYIAGGAQIYGIDKVKNYKLYKKNNHYDTHYAQSKKLVEKRKAPSIVKKRLPDVIIKDLDSKHTFAMASHPFESATISNEFISKYFRLLGFLCILFLFLDKINISFRHDTFKINRKLSSSYSRPPPF